MEDLLSFFTETMAFGFPLWSVLVICCGVFCASFMDAIAGGGGIISVPIYLIGFGSLPTYYTLGTNKLSSGIGTVISTARFIRQGLVNWKLFGPAIIFSCLGSVGGTWLQHHTPDIILKYTMLIVLPITAFFTLKNKDWPEQPEPMSPILQTAIVWIFSFILGAYDGYYGPGTGTFLMLLLIKVGRLDTRHAAGGTKVVNLASNLASMFTALRSGYVMVGIGLFAALFSIAGHYVGSGLAIKNGTKIVRPTIIIVLILLTIKVGSELLFPQFWG